MKYKAFVKDKVNGIRLFIEGEYQSKKEFAHELGANGYAVSKIEPKALYDFMLDHTNCSPREWELAKRLWKDHLPLTKEGMETEESIELLCGGDHQKVDAPKLWICCR